MPSSTSAPEDHSDSSIQSVLVCATLGSEELESLAARFGATVVWLADNEAIKGSYWGEREAGLVGSQLFVRRDTPVHSALHELCHYVCMPPEMRATLDTNAGGDYDEENGVCYLQILLADYLPSFSRRRMWRDMDAWGYTFRLGSAQVWFESDARDAYEWLKRYRLIDASGLPTWSLRESP